jgi:hypothetical protein
MIDSKMEANGDIDPRQLYSKCFEFFLQQLRKANTKPIFLNSFSQQTFICIILAGNAI